MKHLELIIKHKLWTFAKENNSLDLVENLENYLYDTAKLNIIEEIKTPELLEKYLNKLIINEKNFKYEKKLFAYLIKNIHPEKIKEIMNRHTQEVLLLSWIKRNSEKTPYIEFLKYLDKTILENGIFLNYANESSDKIIECAIQYTKVHEIKISEKQTKNLLTLKEIKDDLKIKLLSKFKDEVKKDILEYVVDNIKNEDEKTSYWLIKEFKKEITESQKKLLTPFNCPYNKLMESILADKKNYDLFFESTTLFMDTFFYKVLSFKEKNTSIEDPIDATFKEFKKWDISFSDKEINNIFFKLVNDKSLDYFLNPSQGFNINKQISVEYLLGKMIKMDEQENISGEILKKYLDKIYVSGFHIINRGSNQLFINYVNAQNMDCLLKHPLFEYKMEDLLALTWFKNKELGIQLANNIDEDIVWKYIDTLKNEEKIQFELSYFNKKFEHKTKQKKLKI